MMMTKLYRDSTLRSMTKDQLIKYIKMIYGNWKSCEEFYERTVEYNEKLDKALDKACLYIYYETLNFETIDDVKEWCMSDD